MARLSAALALGFAVALAACGATSSAQPSGAGTGSATAANPAAGGDVTTCALVSAGDVKAAFGGTVADGVTGKTPAYCTFTLTGTLSSGWAVDVMGATVQVNWNSHPTTKDSPVFQTATDPVAGLGVAYYLQAGHALFVSARGGTLTYQAVMEDPNDASIRAALVKLATATYQR
jgi:hypothetical protein